MDSSVVVVLFPALYFGGHCPLSDGINVVAKVAAAPFYYFDYYNNSTIWSLLLFPSVSIIKIGHFAHSTRYIFKSHRTIPFGVTDSQ